MKKESVSEHTPSPVPPPDEDSSFARVSLIFDGMLQRWRIYCGMGAPIAWLILARITILVPLCIALSTMTCGRNAQSCFRSSLLTPLIGFTAISLLSLSWVYKRNPGWLFRGLQLAFDLAIVTWVIYVSGGPQSPFVFLYLPVIMATAILTNRSYALILGGIATALYWSLTEAMVSGTILPFDILQPILIPTGGMLVQLLGLLSANALIAIATSFLVVNANSNRRITEQSQRDLTELASRHELVMNEIPEGVITTDMDETITAINEAAAAVLKLSEVDCIGKPLGQLLKSLDGQLASGGLLIGQREMKVAIPGKEEPLHLNLRGRPLVNENGEPLGSIYLFQDVTKLRSIEEQLRMQEHMSRLLSEEEQSTFHTASLGDALTGETQIMRQVIRLMERVARTDATVLVAGESGTGKELVARGIHKGSERATKPFVAVNCGAIPENLIESQLFGHKRGSFTGADADFIGYFGQADGGTIFLDEIGELPLSMQTKLLRVLQEKNIRPVGGTQDIAISVRIISATNRNLKQEVTEGRFREDLFYRLNVVSLNLPALRQRREDIPLLISAILKRLLKVGQDAIVSPQAMQLLLRYDYPGNVRELENILERALVLGGSVILPEHLPDHLREERVSILPGRETAIIIDQEIQFPVELDTILSTIERHYLERALLRTNGAKKKAADLLGVNFRSLRYRLEKYGLQ